MNNWFIYVGILVLYIVVIWLVVVKVEIGMMFGMILVLILVVVMWLWKWKKVLGVKKNCVIVWLVLVLSFVFRLLRLCCVLVVLGCVLG